MTLSLPWVRHSFFAKIQFSPIGGGEVKDIAEADREAQEFLSHVLSGVMAMLPTASDVERLDAEEQSN